MPPKWNTGQVDSALKEANVTIDKCYRCTECNDNNFVFYCAFCKKDTFKFSNVNSVKAHLRVCQDFRNCAEAKTIPSNVNQLQSIIKTLVETQETENRYSAPKVYNFEGNTTLFVDPANNNAIVSNIQVEDPLYNCQFLLKQLQISIQDNNLLTDSETEKRHLSLSPEYQNDHKRLNLGLPNKEASKIDQIIKIQTHLNQTSVILYKNGAVK